MTNQKTEVWLRGPVDGVPALLQPVAHALLQVVEEIEETMVSFPSNLLWKRPAGLASPGFHLLHMCGVMDRMCTYASGKQLSEEQFNFLRAEKEERNVAPQQLVLEISGAVDKVIQF